MSESYSQENSYQERMIDKSEAGTSAHHATAPVITPIILPDAEDKPFSHGLFDKDPGTTAARKGWLKISILGVLVLFVMIWGILPIYWAALGRSYNNIHNLSGYVVDFDGGEIGQAVRQAFRDTTGPQQMSWLILDAAQFPGGPDEVAQALLDHRCWAAVTVNPQASTNLNASINTADASYNATQAVTAYLTSGRNENIYRADITPQVTSILTIVSHTFALFSSQRLASRSDISTLLQIAPQLVIQPLAFTIHDIRPFNVPVAAAVDYVGLIYLLILAFVLTNQLLAARVESGFEKRLRLRPLILLRLLWPVTLYFFVSLMYSLLSLAFGVPFSRNFGHAGFLIYWMMSWCSMSALGLAIESMITLLTIKFIPIFLILWIISNVSVAFYPIEVLPAVFRYGFAMPFYNVSSTVRTIIFDTKNEIGLNFGIQFSWILISCITLPIFQWLVRRRQIKALEASQRAAREKA
ncbi:uncharacterized protein BJ212DRAFT_203601 [Suillus subaureus]|uniref:DUF3533 domain-containing protein n=1 Tax=Suillus subaureus TaxID=48587 RepID=A0A9P7JCZ0_9AGAM|nr:uncharacterized protein BJ212DRAFT_203601 [Suillus subaureus]KAG1815950.1 hypothetical protein BJ212DRAFT_203601 [Suillus subaureus]